MIVIKHMDKYLLAIIALIIFSILVILYVRISGKNTENLPLEKKSESEDDSKSYDEVVNTKSDPLSHLKADDFTLLE